MDVGMLWFDATPDRSLGAKVERAATYYREKYGRRPNVCYIHHDCPSPTLVLEQPIKVLSRFLAFEMSCPIIFGLALPKRQRKQRIRLSTNRSLALGVLGREQGSISLGEPGALTRHPMLVEVSLPWL